MIVAPIAGALSDRIGGRQLMAAGLALEAAGLAWSAAVTETAVAYGEIIVLFAVTGIGMGVFFAPLANTLLGSVRPEEEGKASGCEQRGSRGRWRARRGGARLDLLAYGRNATPDTFVDGLVPATWVEPRSWPLPP